MNIRALAQKGIKTPLQVALRQGRRMKSMFTLRHLGVKLLDWYIIKKFIGTYIYAIALIISIAIVFDFNEHMSKFATNHAPWRALVFDYYANFVPYFANLFSPLFVFIAVIFFTSKLAGNSEIIAMLASGTSFKRLLRPYMLSAALIAIVNFYLGAYVIPQGTVIRQNFEAQYKNSKKITNNKTPCAVPSSGATGAFRAAIDMAAAPQRGANPHSFSAIATKAAKPSARRRARGWGGSDRTPAGL